MEWRPLSRYFPAGVIEYEAGRPLDRAMVESAAQSRGVADEGDFGDGRHEATWLLLLNNSRG